MLNISDVDAALYCASVIVLVAVVYAVFRLVYWLSGYD